MQFIDEMTRRASNQKRIQILARNNTIAGGII